MTEEQRKELNEVVFITGRRTGKSSLALDVALYKAVENDVITFDEIVTLIHNSLRKE